jgi:hypothetical protein
VQRYAAVHESPLQYLADCPTGPWHEQACLNFTLIPLHPIENVQWGRPTRLRVSRHNDSFSKLYVFGERIGFRPCPHRQRLTIGVPAGFKAKRVVFLDADTIVLRNIDALFNTAKAVDDDDGKDGRRVLCCPGGADAALSAVPDLGFACGTSRAAGVCRRAFARGDQFNSGVMVVRPSRALFEDLLVRRWTTGSMDGGDQGLLNALARSWGNGPGRLSFRYNTFAIEELMAMEAGPGDGRSFDLNRVSVLHFSGLKPWSRGSRRGKIGPKSIQAFDRAMASYRRRCLATSAPATSSDSQSRNRKLMLRDVMLARMSRGGKSPGRGDGTRIHLHEFYGS